MTTTSRIDGAQTLPELQLIDMQDVFIPDAIRGKVQITRQQPLTGELVRDSAGFYFLAPEEDNRGGGMGSIRVHDLSAEARTKLIGKVVKVAGVYESGKGLRVEAIAQQDKEFPDPDGGDRDSIQPGRLKNPYTGQM
ncbi:MAG: hypothetical protein V3T05_13425 [Myxococcota bacterium]